MDVAPSDETTAEVSPELRAFFARSGPYVGKKPSAFYQLGLALVTGTMVLLPLIYVGLTLYAGYGTYFFATHYFASVWEWPVNGRYGVMFKVIASCTPVLMLGMTTLFMVKPLFARRAKAMQPITLVRQQQPLFFALVKHICTLLGAPVPREVRLDCAVNASAGFRRGLLSFLGNDLVLTVGLPLVAGLSTRQLAGVIAHEFGHFRQSAAMRLSYVIRRVNGWFARVIYERDSWDEMLASWSQTDSGWVNLMGGGARFAVWLSRLLLKGLMYFGHAISSFLMRQMEFDADRSETYLAGSGGFESTALRLGELGATTEHLYEEMQRTWRSSHLLPDNIPLLVAHHVGRLSETQRTKLAAESLAEKTGWLDTHPSHADRIAAAHRSAEPGILEDDGPAADLLANFDVLGRFVTLAHYEDDLQIPTTDDFLIPVEAVLRPPSVEAVPAPAPILQAPRWMGLPSGEVPPPRSPEQLSP